jgi:uncharacterized protein (DUF427 family)
VTPVLKEQYILSTDAACFSKTLLISRQSTAMVKVVLNGTVLAQSDSIVKLEGSQYFPPESLNTDALAPSTTT